MTDEQKKSVADFQLVAGKWHLINRTLPAMKDYTSVQAIPPNSMMKLKDGQQILLSPEEGGRLIHVRMAPFDLEPPEEVCESLCLGD